MDILKEFSKSFLFFFLSMLVLFLSFQYLETKIIISSLIGGIIFASAITLINKRRKK